MYGFHIRQLAASHRNMLLTLKRVSNVQSFKPTLFYGTWCAFYHQCARAEIGAKVDLIAKSWWCCWLWHSWHKNAAYHQISHIPFIPSRRLSFIPRQGNEDKLPSFMKSLNVPFCSVTGVHQRARLWPGVSKWLVSQLTVTLWAPVTALPSSR